MVTRENPWPAGTPCWVDISVPDVAAGSAFYAAVLGWDVVDTGEEFGHYRIAQVDGRAAAGLGPMMQEGTPTAWTLYFASDDVDGTAELVAKHGGTLLFSPMEIAGNDLTVNRRRVAGILKAIPRYLPDFRAEDFRDMPVWSGLRPCSPDGLPYIGRFRRYPNLVAATGHAMLGVSLAPVTGRLVADLISGDPPGLDISALSPDRFG